MKLEVRECGRTPRTSVHGNKEMVTPPMQTETAARSGSTGVVPVGPRPVAPPRPAYDDRFSVIVRVICGAIAAAFTLELYRAPSMPALWFAYAIFAFGAFVFGQIAVFGRFGRKPRGP